MNLGKQEPKWGGKIPGLDRMGIAEMGTGNREIDSGEEDL